MDSRKKLLMAAMFAVQIGFAACGIGLTVTPQPYGWVILGIALGIIWIPLANATTDL